MLRQLRQLKTWQMFNKKQIEMQQRQQEKPTFEVI